MSSSFRWGHLVETRSLAPSRDILAFKIKSELIAKGRLSIKISFPYGNHNMTAADWSGDQKHSTEIISTGECHVCLRRIMDNTQYFVKIVYHKDAKLNRIGKNSFSITTNINYMELAVCFSPNEINGIIPSCSDTFSESKTYWQNYWNSGGVIDFEGSTDERANELERRVVLSQYLLAVQCAGSLPPQETAYI